MNRNFAFRLCGELGDTCLNLYSGVSMGNITLVCINAGIELINMTSSIIAWNSERDRTETMQTTLDEILNNYESMKKCDQKKAEIEVKKEKEKSNYRLEKLKLELEKDRDTLMDRIEQLSTQSNNKMEIYIRKSKLTERVRISVKETIELVTQLIENQTSNGQQELPILAELQEKLRVSVSQYTKFVNMCC